MGGLTAWARKRRCPKPNVIRNVVGYMRRGWKEGHASYPGSSVSNGEDVSAYVLAGNGGHSQGNPLRGLSMDGQKSAEGEKGRRSDPRPEHVNPARCHDLVGRRRR